jgi:hypothetical protein
MRNEKILQFPEDFLILVIVSDIDNLANSFIMESVKTTICLRRCKGVNAEEQSKRKTLKLSTLHVCYLYMGLHHIPL